MPDPYDDGCLQQLSEVFGVGEMFGVVRLVPIIDYPWTPDEPFLCW